MRSIDFQIQNNYVAHLKNFGQIANRPKPSIPKSFIKRKKVSPVYKPIKFLNIPSNEATIKYFYNPLTSSSCHRIKSENLSLANRLQSIHLRKINSEFFNVDYLNSNRSIPTSFQHKNRITENVNIAKRIVLTNGGINVNKLQRDFKLHRKYGKLRRHKQDLFLSNSVIMINKRYETSIGQGKYHLNLILKSMQLSHKANSQGLFQLQVVKQQKKFPILSLQVFQKQQINIYFSKRSVINFRILQFKGMEITATYKWQLRVDKKSIQRCQVVAELRKGKVVSGEIKGNMSIRRKKQQVKKQQKEEYLKMDKNSQTIDINLKSNQ